MGSLFFFFGALEPATGALASYLQLLFMNRGFSQSMIGLVIGLGSISQIILPIVFAALVDRHQNEKSVLLLCSVLSILLFIPVSIAKSDVLSVVCFFIYQGFFWTISPVGDSYTYKCLGNHGEKYAPLRAFGTFAYVVFMILFGITGFPDSSSNTEILLNFSYLTALVAVAVCMTRSYKKTDVIVSEQKKSPLIDFKVFDKKFYLFMLIVFVSRISMSVVEKFLFSYIKTNLGMGNRFTLFIALGSFFEIFVMMAGQKLLDMKKIDSLTLLMISCAGLFLRFVLYAMTDNIVVFTLAQCLHGLCFGGCHIAVTDYINKNIPAEHTSMAMTFYWSFAMNLPQLLGSLLCGVAIDNLGYRMMFAVYSVFALIGILLCPVLGTKIRKGNT